MFFFLLNAIILRKTLSPVDAKLHIYLQNNLLCNLIRCCHKGMLIIIEQLN